MSTFEGLNMAKQALSAQQSALQTTQHNVSNVNTDGYSRQRVDFQTAPPYASPGMERPGEAGQKGTGVETGTVERIRNKFLDLQYRGENSKSEYWNAKSESLGRLEERLNEPSDSGISDTMKEFWESLEDLAADPDNTGAKSVVAQRADTLISSFHDTADSIELQRDDLKHEIQQADVKKVNSLLDQIDEVNDDVKDVESVGDLPNDLYDKRDKLIDELSSIVNIKVSYTESGDASRDNADGLASIELADENGKSFGDRDHDETRLLDAEEGEINELNVTFDKDDDGREAISSITVSGKKEEDKEDEKPKRKFSDLDDFKATGSLKGNMESFGFIRDDGGKAEGTHPEMLQDLDSMVDVLVKKFNDVYNDSLPDDKKDFFKSDSSQASSVEVNDDIRDDPDSIVASSGETDSDGDEYGDVAAKMADVFDDTETVIDGSEDVLRDTSINDYYASLIGDLGVEAKEANDMSDNAETLRTQADSRRQSESEVSLDEEMTNLMKFQHAYSAAARSMTTVDETLDTIINNMGLVGR